MRHQHEQHATGGAVRVLRLPDLDQGGLIARHSGTLRPFGGATLKIVAYAKGGNANPASWWCGQRVSAIGINAASSTGTPHTGGNSGAFSSWTNFGSTLDADCGALQWGVNGEGDAVYAAQNYQFEFGAGSQRIGAPMFRCLTAGENGWCVPTGPIFRKLRAGTQLQVRAACNGTAQAVGIAAYAVH
ncbi:MAG: hypothetical protein HC850_03930 [Rhodomicrobium sp.]|nr:hypothetical protein [Rhodomicrobium sp.]